VRSKWAFFLLAATAVLFGQRADASRTPLSDVRAAITQPQQLTAPAAAAEMSADAWLVESITPLGHTDDGQPLVLISLLIPTAHLAENTPVSTRAGPYAAPKTHTRVFYIGQPPLGLETKKVTTTGLLAVPALEEPYTRPGVKPLSGRQQKLHLGWLLSRVTVTYDTDIPGSYSVDIEVERPSASLQIKGNNPDIPDAIYLKDLAQSWNVAMTQSGRTTSDAHRYGPKGKERYWYENLLRMFNPGKIGKYGVYLYREGNLPGATYSGDAWTTSGDITSTREWMCAGPDKDVARNSTIHRLRAPSSGIEMGDASAGSVSFLMSWSPDIHYSGGQAFGKITVNWEEGKEEPSIVISPDAVLPEKHARHLNSRSPNFPVYEAWRKYQQERIKAGKPLGTLPVVTR
jgi:hypothetical protein